MSQHKLHPLTWAALVALLIAATVWGGSRLSTSIWSDEWWTLYYIGAIPTSTPPALHGQTVSATLERIANEGHELNPPGYYLLLMAWARMAGTSELATRWFSLMAGVLALALTFRIGADTFGQRVGLVAAVMVGANAFVLNYFHDMRMYTLVMLWAVMVMWAYGRAIARRGYDGWLFVAVLGLLYTHYFGALLLVPIGFYHLTRWRRGRFWPIVATVLIAGVLFLPWFRVTLGAIGEAQGSIRAVLDRYTIPQTLRYLMSLATNNNALLGWGLFAWGLATRREGVGFIGAAFVGGLATLLAVNIPVPILTEKRYFLHLLPALALLMAVGWDALAARFPMAGAALVVLWAIAGGYNVYDAVAQENIHIRDWHPPIKDVTAIVNEVAHADDTLLYHLPEGSFRSNVPNLMTYYATRANLRGVLIPAGEATLDGTYRGYVTDAADDVSQFWQGYERELRTHRLGFINEEVLPSMGFTACGVLDENAPLHVALYARALPDDGPRFTFDGVTVAALNPLPVRDGALVTAMGWEPAPDFDASAYSIGLHLRDASGAVVRQIDYGLGMGGFACALQPLPLDGLPAGHYTLTLNVYNWQTREPLGTQPLRTVTLSAGA